MMSLPWREARHRVSSAHTLAKLGSEVEAEIREEGACCSSSPLGGEKRIHGQQRRREEWARALTLAFSQSERERERERSLDRKKEDLDINLKGQHVSPRHSTKQTLQHLQVNHVNKMGVGPRNWLNRHFPFCGGKAVKLAWREKYRWAFPDAEIISSSSLPLLQIAAKDCRCWTRI